MRRPCEEGHVTINKANVNSWFELDRFAFTSHKWIANNGLIESIIYHRYRKADLSRKARIVCVVPEWSPAIRVIGLYFNCQWFVIRKSDMLCSSGATIAEFRFPLYQSMTGLGMCEDDRLWLDRIDLKIEYTQVEPAVLVGWGISRHCTDHPSKEGPSHCESLSGCAAPLYFISTPEPLKISHFASTRQSHGLERLRVHRTRFWWQTQRFPASWSR